MTNSNGAARSSPLYGCPKERLAAVTPEKYATSVTSTMVAAAAMVHVSEKKLGSCAALDSDEPRGACCLIGRTLVPTSDPLTVR